MAERSPHQDWLGLLQPHGLVVTARALDLAQIALRDGAEAQARLETFLASRAPNLLTSASDAELAQDFVALATQLLDWPSEALVGPGAIPDALTLPLPHFGETLRADFALRSGDDVPSPWALLVMVTPRGAPFDADILPHERAWPASPQQRLERLLIATGVPVGLLWNGDALRLVVQPPHELSGHLTWPLAASATTLNRPMAAALVTLLSNVTVRRLQPERRLTGLVLESRRFQNTVSSDLAEQVLFALVELLRGFQAADRLDAGRFLTTTHSAGGTVLYEGLLAAILRCIVLLYAEERGLTPDSPTYRQHYGLLSLFEQLREDAGRHPDTLDLRYGAWARLLVVFRLLYDGADHQRLALPARKGDLFDPDRFPFLEGRAHGTRRVMGDRLEPPRVSDGVVYRVLERLLVLRGERLSYRTLDVEQIGAVYENVMGYRLVECAGPTVSLDADLRLVPISALLDVAGPGRTAWLDSQHGVRLPASVRAPLSAATTPETVIAALKPRLSAIQPGLHAVGSWLLEATEARRRSGSHYTPRQLTGPIVERALGPVLGALGPTPTPAQLRGLRVCDPAMGSGAFLVEACRQLGAALAESWKIHGEPKGLSPKDDRLQLAMREIAQTCLYGVDKNPVAVQLGKLSLWLVTLAKDHPFTFLDHALRHGDSLVGLTRAQIEAFEWTLAPQIPLIRSTIHTRLARAKACREAIQALSDSDDVPAKEALLRDAEEALAEVRLIADGPIAAFFEGDSARSRLAARSVWLKRVELWLLNTGKPEVRLEHEEALSGVRATVSPFHWEIEFPEVFDRENGGFDVFVGNPPFLGKNGILNSNPAGYLDWLQIVHEAAHGNADLVAHFFRRAFSLMRAGGMLGLIATNTLAQGDTRESGLRWIVANGGTITNALKRFPWPGLAAVVVSVVNIRRGPTTFKPLLDGVAVPRISAFLLPGHQDRTPPVLVENESRGFIGSYVLGMGFTFDDTNPDATPLAEMHRLIETNPSNRERIFPYIGGEELNTSADQSHHRYVINFATFDEHQAKAWPDLYRIVEEKVKPSRDRLADNADGRRRKRFWWQWGRYTPALFEMAETKRRVLATSRVSSYHCMAFQPTNRVFSEQVVVFAFDSNAAFALLQSRVHEVWAKFLASSLEDRTRYTPTDCFETFPFPARWEHDEALEIAGREYDVYRGELMVRLGIGMTALYNRMHNPDDQHQDIRQLRELHAAMDRAVLSAYGWSDLDITCDFHVEVDERVRLRWPDATRDAVIARLLDLNAQRAAPAPAPPTPSAMARPTRPTQGSLGLVDTPLLQILHGESPKRGPKGA